MGSEERTGGVRMPTEGPVGLARPDESAVPTPVYAFLALVSFSFRRHVRLRQVAVIAFALLGLIAVVVAVLTHASNAWRLETREQSVVRIRDDRAANDNKSRDELTREHRRLAELAHAVSGGIALVGVTHDSEYLADYGRWVRMTFRQYGDDRLTFYQAYPGPPAAFGIKSAVVDAYRAVLRDERYLNDYAFLTFSRWVVFSLFLAFLMPLFTLAYGSGALGGERESRTLLWLCTRPLPRWSIYVAKLLGVLPWCVGVCMLAFGVLCLVGGDLGRRAAGIYWPTVLAGSLAFGCVFHLFGAVFRRPTVVGLVYVFFFETLVANLPGSLKQFSLNYYVRSLLYNEMAEHIPTVQPESVDVYAPADPTTAWVTLLVVAVLVTAVGGWLFGRQEPKDEV